jgi:hypothetical protein
VASIETESRGLAARLSVQFGMKISKSKSSSIYGAPRLAYRMKANFIEIDLELNAYHPYTELFIQNISFEREVSFSINQPSMQIVGADKLVPTALSKANIPVFANPFSPSLGNAAWFFDYEDNEIDIRKLGLGDEELLLVLTNQMVLRSKTDDVGIIKERLLILKRIIIRTATLERGRLVSKKARGMAFSSRPSGKGGIRFGGKYNSRTKCMNCAKSMHRLLSVAAELLKELHIPFINTLDVLFCLNCQVISAPTFYKSNAEGGCEIIEQPKQKTFGDFNILAEYEGELTPVKKRSPRHQLGGSPIWIQSSHWLTCPRCAKMMSFLLQLDTDPSLGIQFGDSGILYSFICKECAVIGNVVQSK